MTILLTEKAEQDLANIVGITCFILLLIMKSL